ncbi:hypothetical protein F3Y22_tig00110621pilonHSYRG00132 [Hibiscus syriacus]|uniref:Uncharacterized protein n=1 Tax=Hibiscus syriacus TaxID=106335 RepID=A0A6A3A2E4_HIBSY|nr:hypothetical protein F3Y22_tig00110621pilonHSYRG00132 [Hibiscus syriacus]
MAAAKLAAKTNEPSSSGSDCLGFSRTFSSDAVVEVKPGEVGMVLESPTNIVGGWENPLMGWTSTGDPYANVGDSALD